MADTPLTLKHNFHIHKPYSLWHVDILASVTINVGHQGEVCLKALHSEQAVHKGVEEALVKVVVYAATIDALGEKGTHGAPGYLVGRKVGTTLYE